MGNCSKTADNKLSCATFPVMTQVRHDDLKEARITFAKALEDAEAYLLEKMPS